VGAAVLAAFWAGSVALIAILLVLTVGPMFGALGCPGGCPDDPPILRAGRLALGIAVAFLAFAGTLWTLMTAARRTRVASLGLALLGAVLLVPTAGAVLEVVRGEASAGWPLVPFLGLGVPGLLLAYAAWAIWRPPRASASP
jgi:hypothetical protein